MTQRLDGDFDVSPNEQISIIITKTKPNCSAGLSISSNATLSCQPCTFPTCQQCSFTAPGNSGADVILDMSLIFQSDAQGNFAAGDKYTVIFSGAGKSGWTSDFFPPSKLNLIFQFFVS